MRTNDKKNQPSGERPDLDRRYGEIGISAVAAAVRYQSQTRGSAKRSAAESTAAPSIKERDEVAA